MFSIGNRIQNYKTCDVQSFLASILIFVCGKFNIVERFHRFKRHDLNERTIHVILPFDHCVKPQKLLIKLSNLQIHKSNQKIFVGIKKNFNDNVIKQADTHNRKIYL